MSPKAPDVLRQPPDTPDRDPLPLVDIDWGDGGTEVVELTCDLSDLEACESCT